MSKRLRTRYQREAFCVEVADYLRNASGDDRVTFAANLIYYMLAAPVEIRQQHLELAMRQPMYATMVDRALGRGKGK